MEYKLDFERINKFSEKNGKYIYRRRLIANVLPLPTREPERAKFEKGFISIVGGVIRKVNGKDIQDDIDDSAINKVIELGNFKGTDSKEFFTYYLTEQLKDLTSGKINTFNQLEKVPFVDNISEQKGEKEFVSFFFDTFIGEDVGRVQEIFREIDDSHLISEILDLLSMESNKQKQENGNYKSFFPDLKEQFLKDLETLSKNQSFFLDNISAFFVHYTFVAMSHIILQTNRLTRFEEEGLTPVYYILQWEKAARWRSSYTQGYKLLKNEMEEFYGHEHVLNIIGLNTFTDRRNLYYHDFKRILSEAGFDAEKEFIQSIYKWLKEVYERKTGIRVESYTSVKTIDDAFKDLIQAVKPGISKEINSRYQKAFESMVSKFFRKHGGSLGTLLSLTQEQLLLLVAISVGEDRIELKQLWRELELRGVWLDHHSKEEVVKILDKLNYMEKKSDSGDAQYVKSIL